MAMSSILNNDDIKKALDAFAGRLTPFLDDSPVLIQMHAGKSSSELQFVENSCFKQDFLKINRGFEQS